MTNYIVGTLHGSLWSRIFQCVVSIAGMKNYNLERPELTHSKTVLGLLLRDFQIILDRFWTSVSVNYPSSYMYIKICPWLWEEDAQKI